MIVGIQGRKGIELYSCRCEVPIYRPHLGQCRRCSTLHLLWYITPVGGGCLMACVFSILVYYFLMWVMYSRLIQNYSGSISFTETWNSVKRGWPLTTSQYTITHYCNLYTLEFKEQLLKIQKLHIKQTRNLHIICVCVSVCVCVFVHACVREIIVNYYVSANIP